MLIKWLGHASFIIKAAGLHLITDPFDEKTGYRPYLELVDIATVSHQHWDHNATHILQGNPLIIDNRDTYSLSGLTVKGIASFHDSNQGARGGENNIYKIMTEDIDLVHLGDLGHIPNPDLIKAIGSVDILLIPVGGKFTLNGEQAVQVVELLQPKIVIPMHFQTSHLSFALAPVEDFTKNFERVIKQPALTITKADLTPALKIVVLDYPAA